MTQPSTFRSRRGALQHVALIAIVIVSVVSLLTPQTVRAGQARPADLVVPDGFVVETVSNVLDWPTAFAFLPDGRMLVGEKSGMLKMIENGVVRAQPVIDLRHQVNDYVDRGLIDVAVDPEFTKNHYIYLFYTYRPPTLPHDSPSKVMGRVERYTLDGNVLRLSSVKTILDDFESTRENHSVNSIRWSPEGYMFVSFGEGAPSLEISDLAMRSQNIDDLGGKLIRINREDGSGVPGNPFYDAKNPRSVRSRVWAYGLRNPFRFAVHPVTGIPYVGNVGDILYESLYRVLPGQNFGWPCREGILNLPPYQAKPGCKGLYATTVAQSEWDYPHQGKNASITGGDFNFGTNFPSSMVGDYFLADYSVQWIKRAVLGKDGKVIRIENFAEGMGEPVDLKFGPDGLLYYLSIYSGGLRRIRYQSGNNAPIARFTASRLAGPAPLTVAFDASASTDPDGGALSFTWDFGDGAKAQGVSASHTFTDEGQYLVRLTATDAKQAHAQRITETLVTAGDAAPQVAITAPGNGDVYLPGQPLRLSAQDSDLTGLPLPASQTGWRLTLHDGSQTRVLTDTTGPALTLPMPSATADGAYVEALFSARSGEGKVGATHVDVYLPSQDGYIRTWWLSGGSPSSTLDDDRLPGGEAQFIVKPGDPLFQLVRAPAASHKVTLLDYITPQNHNVAYGFIWVDVPEDRKGLLGMMSDDGLAVWLNGKLIWHNKVSRFIPDDMRDIDLPPIELKKGLNALLVKVDQNDGDWAFKVRVLNPDGSNMQDATVKTVAH